VQSDETRYRCRAAASCNRPIVLWTVIQRKNRKLRTLATTIGSPTIDTIFGGEVLPQSREPPSRSLSITKLGKALGSPKANPFTPGSRAVGARGAHYSHSESLSRHCYQRRSRRSSPLRLRAKLPRQRYLPKATSISRCRRSLIIKRIASSSVSFLDVSGNLLRFSHEGIIDFAICANGLDPRTSLEKKTSARFRQLCLEVRVS
jgi:hypothetical protein